MLRVFNQLKVYLTTALSYGRKINNVLEKYSFTISFTEEGNVIRSLLYVNALRRLSTCHAYDNCAFQEAREEKGLPKHK